MPVGLAEIEQEILNLESAENTKKIIKCNTIGLKTVPIWDTKTGEKRITLNYMLRTQLNKMVDGKRKWTTIDPKIPQKITGLKCLLHADDDNRAHYDELGLPVCRKSNIPSPFQVEMHMKKKHPQEYAMMLREQAIAEKAEETQLRRLLLSKATKGESADGETPWGELKSKASGMGINTKGMKRAGVEAAIKAKQEGVK